MTVHPLQLALALQRRNGAVERFMGHRQVPGQALQPGGHGQAALGAFGTDQVHQPLPHPFQGQPLALKACLPEFSAQHADPLL